MRRLLYIMLPVFAVVAMAFGYSDADSIAAADTLELVDINAKAIGDIVSVDGQLIVADSVPCFSFAKERKGLFFRIKTESYINCSTCTKEWGRGIGDKSHCISVRKIAVDNDR